MRVAKVTSKLPEQVGLAEIYQSMDLKFSLLSKLGATEFERITPAVKCRDFLADCYSFGIAKKDFAIYGMSFRGSKECPQLDGVHLLVTFPNQDAYKNFKDNLSVIHEVEYTNKIPKTEILSVDKPLTYVVDGAPEWVMNGMAFTLYTLLLRCLCYNAGTGESPTMAKWLEAFCKTKNTDRDLLDSVQKSVWPKLFADLSLLHTKQWCGFDPAKDGVGMIHHNSGFISVFGKHREISFETVKKNAHWQEMKAKGFELHPNTMGK